MIAFWIFLAWVFVLLGFKLWWDWRARTKFKRIINHGRSAAIDTVLYVAAAVLLSGFTWSAFWLVLIGAVTRWTLFDLLYNLIFKNHWAYCGENSLLDRWGDDLDGVDDDDCKLLFVLKLLIIIHLIVLYFLGWG